MVSPGGAATKSIKKPIPRAGSCQPPTADRTMRPLLGTQHFLGHESIDLEHKAIADWWLLTVNCQEIQFPFFIARLKRLMHEHFVHEATLLKRAGTSLCECHEREHRLLLDLCDEAATLGRSNWRQAQSLLRNKLPKLVREHIVSMDQLAVLLINTAAK